MPLVKVEDAKGLYQTSGTGFQFIDGQAQPAQETIRHAVQVVTCVADSSDSLDGTYFDIFDTTQGFRVWFDMDNNNTVGAPDSGGLTLVEVAPTTDDTAATISGLIETALENANSGNSFECSNESNGGNISVFCKVPGALAGSFNARTSGFSASTTDGSGSATISTAKKVTVLEAATPGASDNPLAVDGSALNMPALGDGSYIGQEKIIIRNDAINVAYSITTGDFWHDDANGNGATEELAFIADTAAGTTSGKLRMLHLIWSGYAWVRTGAGAGSAVGASGVTGNTAS